jgi:hypothetical protein
MARQVFFSFHYSRDIQRVETVRNSGLLQDISPFYDKAEREKIKRGGEQAIRNWIRKQLHNTSVTVVLIGHETSSRPWVLYEIDESFSKGNGLIGVYIHNIRNFDGQRDVKGGNPFNEVYYTDHSGQRVFLSSFVKTYDWVEDGGRNNISRWVEDSLP